MGQNTGEIEREIRNARTSLSRNLDELEGRARELKDWRTHYRHHTNAFIGAAFLAGAVVAMVTVPSAARRPRGQYDYDPAYDTSHDPYWEREPVQRFTSGSATAARAKRELSDTWGQIADALLRTASAFAIEFVAGLVPRFREHVRPIHAQEDRIH